MTRYTMTITRTSTPRKSKGNPTPAEEILQICALPITIKDVPKLMQLALGEKFQVSKDGVPSTVVSP